jgi:hypothetical protein
MQDGWTSESRYGARAGYDLGTRRLCGGPQGRDGVNRESAMRMERFHSRQIDNPSCASCWSSPCSEEMEMPSSQTGFGSGISF